MARAIYKITLKDNLVPANSKQDALDMFNMDPGYAEFKEEDVNIEVLAKEEHAVKLFYLAKTMYDTEKFDCQEVEAAVRALATSFGYFSTAQEITDCILIWVERIADDMTEEEFQEWLIS